MTDVFMDISPLFEPEWSGIARVTSALCKALLLRGDVTFFYRDVIIDEAMVAKTLSAGSASGLRILLNHGFASKGNLVENQFSKQTVGIYPNIKTDRKQFERFCLIVYDLSFVITPEFHDKTMVAGYCRNLWLNAQEASVILAISEATKRDLVAYFGVNEAKIFVAHLGVNIVLPTKKEAPPVDRPYFLVLGTIEPRKNISMVLDFIRFRKEVLLHFDFVFVGKDGWGQGWSTLIAARGLDDPRIRHRGFLPDRERDDLIEGCEALIFPSFFEGYGLPVLEAMARGKIVLASRSSGIVEAGAGCIVDFDPTNLSSFSRAFDRFVAMSAGEREALSDAGFRYAKTQTWERFGGAAMRGFGITQPLL